MAPGSRIWVDVQNAVCVVVDGRFLDFVTGPWVDSTGVRARPSRHRAPKGSARRLCLDIPRAHVTFAKRERGQGATHRGRLDRHQRHQPTHPGVNVNHQRARHRPFPASARSSRSADPRRGGPYRPVPSQRRPRLADATPGSHRLALSAWSSGNPPVAPTTTLKIAKTRQNPGATAGGGHRKSSRIEILDSWRLLPAECPLYCTRPAWIRVRDLPERRLAAGTCS